VSTYGLRPSLFDQKVDPAIKALPIGINLPPATFDAFLRIVRKALGQLFEGKRMIRVKRFKRLILYRVQRYRSQFRYWKSLGAWGERKASRYLTKKGLWIRHRNWKCALGELDIVAQDRGTLVVIEVKTRQAEVSHTFAPEDAVDLRKSQKIEAVTKWYLKRERVDIRRKRLHIVRFDTIAITARSAGFGWKVEKLNWMTNNSFERYARSESSTYK
jgi:putative endonuclease